VIRLSRMVEEMSTEHAQLQAERDRLGEYVANLQTQQQQPRASVADLKAQVSGRLWTEMREHISPRAPCADEDSAALLQ